MCIVSYNTLYHKLGNMHDLVWSTASTYVILYYSALSIAFYNEVQVLRQRQVKQEKEAMLKRVMVSLVSDVIKDVTNQEVLNLATAEIRYVGYGEQTRCVCPLIQHTIFHHYSRNVYYQWLIFQLL